MVKVRDSEAKHRPTTVAEMNRREIAARAVIEINSGGSFDITHNNVDLFVKIQIPQNKGVAPPKVAQHGLRFAARWLCQQAELQHR